MSSTKTDRNVEDRVTVFSHGTVPGNRGNRPAYYIKLTAIEDPGPHQKERSEYYGNDGKGNLSEPRDAITFLNPFASKSSARRAANTL